MFIDPRPTIDFIVSKICSSDRRKNPKVHKVISVHEEYAFAGSGLRIKHKRRFKKKNY